MTLCDEVNTNTTALAALPPAEVPGRIRAHVEGCHRCRRRLAVARMTQALVKAGGADVDPPAGFAHRVAALAASQPAPVKADAELWRPAWGFVPAFGALVVLLLILFQGSPRPETPGLLLTENLSTGERYVLGSSSLDVDMVMAAVFEGEGR